MTLATAIGLARQANAGHLTQRCTIRRPTGDPVFDPETEQSTQPAATLHTDLPCKVKSPRLTGSDLDVGQTEVRLTNREIKFPVATDVAEGDVVEITAGTFNTVDIGATYRISDVDRREQQVTRRCAIEEISVPSTWIEVP